MKMRLEQSFELQTGFQLRFEITPVLGLSIGQIRQLLRAIAEDLDSASPNSNRTWESGWSTRISNLALQVRHDYAFLSSDIFITADEEKLFVEHDHSVLGDIDELIGALARHRRLRGRIERLRRELAWMIRNQLAMCQYVVQKQESFVRLQDPRALKPLTINSVASTFGYHSSTVSRLLTSVCVVLPNGGEVLPIRRLLPDESQWRVCQVHAALDELKLKSNYFGVGWSVTWAQLAELVNAATGIRISPHAIGDLVHRRGEARQRGTSRTPVQKQTRSCSLCGQRFEALSEKQWKQVQIQHETISKRHQSARMSAETLPSNVD